MVPAEILFKLVPGRDPEDDYPRDAALLEFDPNSPGRRIGVWASYLRHRIRREIIENPILNELIGTSGFIATGVFHVPNPREAKSFPGFEIISGYQFGALLLRSTIDRTPVDGISLEFGRYRAPLLQTRANFNPHSVGPDGYVAALFRENDGNHCGITAAHVVAKFAIGQRVPVLCSACGTRSRLKRKAPGLIDAAVVEFPCGGPIVPNANTSMVRSAVEGETIEAHFGDTGKMRCTVMCALQTKSQIISAAIPKHFLTDIHGHPGDSGSLVSEEGSKLKEPDLIGIYLGETDCMDENHNYVTYGYALDLKQAADLLGASNLQGEFNV